MTEVWMILGPPACFGVGLWLGWWFWGVPLYRKEPKVCRHDWRRTYLDNAVARYCLKCHEAHVSPYLAPDGQPALIKSTKP